MRRSRCSRPTAHENVIFTGVIDDISRAYSGADVFFMPSHAETFGLVIVEALYGLPVIARSIFEFREIFGILSSFLRCWRGAGPHLLTMQPSDAVQRSPCLNRGYDISLIAKRHQELYKELIEG